MLANQAGMMGGALQIPAHAFGKMTLFMCAGAIYVATGKKAISEMRGLGRRMPWVFGAFLVGSLSIIGIPPMVGGWPKVLLMLGAADSGDSYVAWVLVISSLLNIAYLLPIPLRAFFKVDRDAPAGITEAPAACLIAICTAAPVMPAALARTAPRTT